MTAENGLRQTCDHEECCRYFLCAHPKCCGYAVPTFSGGTSTSSRPSQWPRPYRVIPPGEPET